MGVRGLSTYISQNPDYFVPLELHNTYLVIDAENFVNHCYRGSKLPNHYGGEYLGFTICVRKFIRELEQCNIKPIFVFDGCHEMLGLKHETLLKRNEERISSLRDFIVRSSYEDDAEDMNSPPDLLPTLTFGVFVDILQQTGTYYVSPEREADVHIAELACLLNAPLVSNDSDFFIFRSPSANYNYQFIPLNNLGQQPIRSSKPVCQSCLSGCYVLPCSMFRPNASLLGHVHPPLLPLLATLLGNDFISAVRLPNTVEELIRRPSRSGLSYNGRRIDALIRWLGSFGSDVRTPLMQILSLYQEAEIRGMAEKLIQAIMGYVVHPLCTGRELASVLNLGSAVYRKSKLQTIVTSSSNKTLSHSVASTTTTQARQSELHRVVSMIVNALPTSDCKRSICESCVTKREAKIVFRWTERLIRLMQGVGLVTGILDTLYVTGGSVQRIMFEDVVEESASIYTVVDPLRQVFYNLLVGFELNRGCLSKLRGLCEDKGMELMEYRRKADCMCPFPISVKPALSSTSSNVDRIQFFNEHFDLNLDQPKGLSSDLRVIRAVLMLWFRHHLNSSRKNQLSGTCCSVALAFAVCALTTHAYLSTIMLHIESSMDDATSRLCESFTILANSIKWGCPDLRYSVRLVHQINELQLLMLELKHLWDLLDSLCGQDSDSYCLAASGNVSHDVVDDDSALLIFYPDWMLFPSGRLVYWIAHKLEEMRPESRWEAVLHTWLPRLHEAGRSARVGTVCELGVLKEQFGLLFDLDEDIRGRPGAKHA